MSLTLKNISESQRTSVSLEAWLRLSQGTDTETTDQDAYWNRHGGSYEQCSNAATLYVKPNDPFKEVCLNLYNQYLDEYK